MNRGLELPRRGDEELEVGDARYEEPPPGGVDEGPVERVDLGLVVQIDLRRRVGGLARVPEGDEVLLLVGQRDADEAAEVARHLDAEGQPSADDGVVWSQPGLRISRLRQDVPHQEKRLVFDVITEGLGELSRLIRDYHAVAMELTYHPSPENLKQLEHLQQALEAADGWRIQQRIETVISKLELPSDKPMNALSGGWRRRVLLAPVSYHQSFLVVNLTRQSCR